MADEEQPGSPGDPLGQGPALGPVIVILVPGMPGSELDFVPNGGGRPTTVFSLRAGWILGALRRLGAIGRVLPVSADPPVYRGVPGRIVAARVVPARGGLPRRLGPFLPRALREDFSEFLGYEPLLRSLRAIPGMSAPELVQAWPYDWRRSITDNAESLYRFLEVIASRATTTMPQFVLIGHSTGGIVCAQTILMLPEIAKPRRLITIGTPWHGTYKAARMLVNGPGLGAPVRDAVRSMPGVREVISSAPGTFVPEPCRSLRNSTLVERAARPGTGANFEILRGAVTGNLGCPHTAFVGTSRSTPSLTARGRLRAGRIRIAGTRDGDGVVTVSSARRRRGETVVPVSGDHDNLPAHPDVMGEIVDLVTAIVAEVAS